MKAFSRVVAILFVTLTLATCRREATTPQTSSPTQPAKSLQHVTLATSTNLWCALPLIAKDRGYFQEEGLDVAINIQDGGRYCMDALLGGSAQFANVVETNIAYLAFTGNKDVRVVANVVDSTSMAVVAWKTSGIAKPEDLAGKRLAFTPATQGEIFAARFLKKHGVPLDLKTVRKLPPKAIPAAIGAHEVDAASTWEPFVNAALKAMGNDGIVFRDPDAHRGYMHVAVRDGWAQQNQQAVTAFIRALKKADEFGRAHPDEAKTILAKQTKLDITTINAIWDYYNMHLTLDRPGLIAATTAVGQWIKESQPDYAPKPLPDYSPYYDDRYFRAAQ